MLLTITAVGWPQEHIEMANEKVTKLQQNSQPPWKLPTNFATMTQTVKQHMVSDGNSPTGDKAKQVQHMLRSCQK